MLESTDRRGWTRRRTAGSLALLLAAGLSAAGRADEIADLVKAVNPPPRFGDHVPSFVVRDDALVFPSPNGGTNVFRFKAILDHDRYVAIFPEPLHSLDLLTHDPLSAPRSLPNPGRYSPTAVLGVRITTVPCGRGNGRSGDETQWTIEATDGGRSVTLTERQRWTVKPQAESEHIHVLRCDPVLGYTLDTTCRLRTNEAKVGGELVNLLPAAIASPFPDEWRYDYTAVTEEGSDRIVGWANNGPAADGSGASGLGIRKGGFVAFLPPRGSALWAPALSPASPRATVRFRSRTDPVWMAQSNEFEDSGEPGTNGFRGIEVTYRLVHLPPEAAALVHDRLTLKFADRSMTALRVGVLEDFDSQPLPMTYPARGMRVPLAETAGAHSGRKCAVFVAGDARAERRHYLTAETEPALPLRAGCDYRLDAWLKVEGTNTEARLLVETQESMPTVTGTVGAGPGWTRVSASFPCVRTQSGRIAIAVRGGGTVYLDDFQFIRQAARPLPAGSERASGRP